VQKQILELLLQEYDNNEIATKLEIKQATLRKHLFRMREKLNVKTNIGIVLLAMQEC
jgi:two-component system response regulator EvgA